MWRRIVFVISIRISAWENVSVLFAVAALYCIWCFLSCHVCTQYCAECCVKLFLISDLDAGHLVKEVSVKTMSYWHHVRRSNIRLTSDRRWWYQYDVVLMLIVVSRIFEQLKYKLPWQGANVFNRMFSFGCDDVISVR